MVLLRLWCSCKHINESYRHLHVYMWNDPGPSMHLLFHVLSPYGGIEPCIQNAIIPFNCDINDQIESNSVFIVKLTYLIFSIKTTLLLFTKPHTVSETRCTNSGITVLGEELRAAHWGPRR